MYESVRQSMDRETQFAGLDTSSPAKAGICGTGANPVPRETDVAGLELIEFREGPNLLDWS